MSLRDVRRKALARYLRQHYSKNVWGLHDAHGFIGIEDNFEYYKRILDNLGWKLPTPFLFDDMISIEPLNN